MHIIFRRDRTRGNDNRRTPFIPCPSKNSYLIIAFLQSGKRTILDSLTRPTKRERREEGGRNVCRHALDAWWKMKNETRKRERKKEKKRQRRRRGKILKISLGLLAVYTFSDNQRRGIDCTNAAREAFRITVRNNLHPPVSRRLAVTVIAIPRRHFDPTFDRTTNAFSNEMRIDTR